MANELKQVIRNFVLSGDCFDTITISVDSAVDAFYVREYRRSQTSAQAFKNQIDSVLERRLFFQDKRSETKADLEEFRNEIQEVTDGSICKMLKQHIENYEEVLKSFVTLGERAEELQVKLDETIELSTRLAARMIKRKIVTFEQIQNHFYFYSVGKSEIPGVNQVWAA